MKGKSLNKTASNIVQSADHIITAVGTAIVRYGLVVVIAWIGLMKFTGSEAMRIQQFISHSPFMSWLNGILSIRAQSDVIGTIEPAAGPTSRWLTTTARYCLSAVVDHVIDPVMGQDGLHGRSGDRNQMCAESCCRNR